jgi:metal-responsive CopG/Arc/MetJ family transcriptional regulator
LTKLTVLFRPDEQNVLDALDRYGLQHGLKSRSQVLRAALSQLLNIDLEQPHWGWTAGRRRR